MCESVDMLHVDPVPRRPSALWMHRTLDIERAGVEGRGEMREEPVVSGEQEGSDLLLRGGLARRTALKATVPVPARVCLDPILFPRHPDLEARPTSRLVVKPLWHV